MADMASLVKQDVDVSQDESSALIITCAVLLPLTWIAVGLRTYTRAVLTRSFKIDDWFMLIAQIIFTSTCAMIIEGTRRGLGKHNKAVTDPDDMVAALMWQAIATAVYVLNMVFIKLSIGVFLLRLAVWTAYKWILWISLVVFTLWGLGIFIWNIFQCNPVAKQWDFRIEGGYCASPDAIISSAYALSALTILSDWLYALLPIPMVWNVKMTKQAKWTVVAILGLGVFASVATIVRLRFLNKLQEIEDLLYSAIDAMVWTIVEPGLAIFGSSLATIRPLLRALRIRGFTSSGGTSADDTMKSPDMSTTGGYSGRKMSTRPESTSAAAGISDMSLDNIDDESDFREPDAVADNDDVSLESKGRPQRKRPNNRVRGDSLSDILAMEDGLSSSVKDDEFDFQQQDATSEKHDATSEKHDATYEKHGVTSEKHDIPAQKHEESNFRQPDVPADNHDVSLESKGRPQRKRPSNGRSGDSLSEILAMDDGLPSSVKDDESNFRQTDVPAENSKESDARQTDVPAENSKESDARQPEVPAENNNESDSRQPDVPADNHDVSLESTGRPQRRRPKNGLHRDSLSEILAMDDGLPSSVKDSDSSPQSADEASTSKAHKYGPHDLEAQTGRSE